ncbi:hypothetical protein K1T71_007486 [Dendrolimus kikuchii]|uniref:Uncharacterized protein n=1 Tax=Dendrolimus kikuchii TaxID=765133 RepID=A0ACC1D1R7_9NEOP|nr:hypothetical protein K1T71_007486 [Dendrolimus kikuchii]
MEMSKEIADLTKKRSSFKGRMDLFSKFLGSLDSTSLTSNVISELELRIGKLELLYARYDETQSRLECLSDFETQITEREVFESMYYQLISQAQQIVANHKKSPQSSDSSSHSYNNKPIKLPTIQLPKFNGSYDSWLEYRDTFNSLILSNEDIDVINKFHYLRASLEGTAAVVVNSVQFCASNYSIAWKLLCDRFDNKRLLIQNHVSSLFNMDRITQESSTTLKRMMDQFTKNMCALNSLGEPVQHWDSLLIHIIAQKLDFKTYRKWEEYRGHLNREKTIKLHDFLDFMKIRTDLLETIELSRDTPQYNNDMNTKIFNHQTMLSTDSIDNNNLFKSLSVCPKCSGNHKLKHCSEFLSLNNEARLKIISDFKICFNCFHRGHYANQCKKPGCNLCKRRHNTLIHVTDYNTLKSNGHSNGKQANNNQSSPATEGANPVALSANILPSHQEDSQRVDVLLPTALIKVFDSNNREHIARAVLDTGSTCSLMSMSLRNKLNLPYNCVDKSIQGINNVKSHVNKKCYMSITSFDGKFKSNLKCFVLRSILDNVPSRPVVLNELNIPTDLPLADPNFHMPAAIDLILGADVFWDILGSQRLNLGTRKPALTETRLGWLVSGSLINI